MSKIGEKIGKTILKTVKAFGVRPDDITDMITEFGLDELVANQLESIDKKEEETPVLLGYYDNEEFKFRVVGISTDNNLKGEEVQKIANSYPVDFFGSRKDKFTLTELVNELIKLAFNSDKK